ncbi:MAG: hypothetical protein ABI671_09175 [Burkholderiales bacterium]
MGPIDALWHLLNFFAPALGVGLLTALMAKLLWRRSLKAASLKRLSVWAVSGSALALLVGLVAFGSDGKMLTYGAMVLMCALSVWWAGFGPRRR